MEKRLGTGTKVAVVHDARLDSVVANKLGARGLNVAKV